MFQVPFELDNNTPYQSNLIDLNLNVSSEKQANHICNNWKKNASHMHAEVINLLTTYKK